MQSISYAYQDALQGVSGKAAEYKILPNDANDNKLTDFVQDKKSYFIVEDGYSEDALYLRNFLNQANPGEHDRGNVQQGPLPAGAAAGPVQKSDGDHRGSGIRER